jgi:hypothetical protein
MDDIALIGTDHDYQAFGRPGAADLEYEIERILNAYNFAAVAEEMSREGLERRGATESVCKRVADKRSLRHRYCDPDRQTRSRLDIQDENLIRALGQMSGKSDQETDHQICEAHSQREQYWLDRLLELDLWPVLFVCGANHVDTFAAKAMACRRTVGVLHRDWAPAV